MQMWRWRREYNGVSDIGSRQGKLVGVVSTRVLLALDICFKNRFMARVKCISPSWVTNTEKESIRRKTSSIPKSAVLKPTPTFSPLPTMNKVLKI